MNEKRLIFQFIILSILLLVALTTDDTCPKTMLKTYADNSNLVQSVSSKYDIRYESSKVDKTVSYDYSYFNLIKEKININEEAYVDVFFKDSENIFIGLKKEKLENLKSLTEVKGTKGSVTVKFDFDSITNTYALRYKKKFTISGEFKISAYYNSLPIDNKEKVKGKISDEFDILYLVDATGSMGKELQAAKDQVINIAMDLKAKYPKLNFKFGAIFYRDKVVNPKGKNELFDLTDNIQNLKKSISKINPSGGGSDGPEDWVTAYKLSIENIKWRKGTRLIIHIADYGGHGAEFSNKDRYSSEGPKMIPLIKKCVEMGIKIIGFKIGKEPTKSFNKLVEIYNKYKESAKDLGQFIKIYDFKRGSTEEVSKLFRNLVNQAADEAVPTSDILTVIDNLDHISYKHTKIVSPNCEKIKVGEILKMWLYTYDEKGKCMNKDYSSHFKITVIGPLESPFQTTKIYSVKYNNKPNSECNNEHEIITKDDDIYKYAGNYLIKVEAEGTLIAQYNQICSPLDYDINGFLLKYSFDPNKISILDTVTFTVSGADKYGNKVNEKLLDKLTIEFTKDKKITTSVESSKVENEVGIVEFQVAIREIGSHQLHMKYNGKEITKVNGNQTLPIFTILIGPCTAKNNNHFDLSPLEKVDVNDNAYFKFQCYDAYNNLINKGGEKFTAIGKVIFEQNEIEVTTEVVDNGDGSYNVKFIPEYLGVYKFKLLIGKEKYGEEFTWTLATKICDGDKPILCPNMRECVKNLVDCILPKNDCEETKPFRCLVNGIYTCVKSQTECDCPEGYIKCSIGNYCVKQGREDMCPFFLINHRICTKYGKDYKMFSDGICRPKSAHEPNKRVCPIGKVLCPDLSCRNNNDECAESEESLGNQIRCLDQSIASDADKCPSTITCQKEDDVVCPDSTCVPNEIYCPGVKKCPRKEPYLCHNNQCAIDRKSCMPNISCGHKNSLCHDYICREHC